MISFKLTDEQEVVREAMHDFAEQAIRPVARDADEASEVPEDLLAQTWELGLVSTQLPEEFGGAGEARSPVTNVILLEELAWGDATYIFMPSISAVLLTCVPPHASTSTEGISTILIILPGTAPPW